MSKLVIVESPTKAKTIRGYLPKGYTVEASMGHVRDLPASAAEIPAAAKGAPWARLGVNVEKDFEPLYVVPAAKKKVVTRLKQLLADADELILATDEDREGESIGWHLQEVLKPRVPVRRMVFHEITRDAIEEALREMRTIDQDLVRAQETRRILDRLVGYTVSPLLWKKIAPRLSAGRVQSVAVRLLVMRERERRAFRAGFYWDLTALLAKQPDAPRHRFEALLVAVGDRRIATGRDFDENTGRIVEGKQDLLLLDEAQAAALAQRIRAGRWVVSNLESREESRSPQPPFTTSTLQQEANRKLGLGAKETMRVAQNLYENGYITYMRTDSVNLSQQAIDAARRRIGDLYGEQYLNSSVRRYTARTKNAQEAHEAIRPAGDRMLPAEDLPLSGRERQLYDLIWKRTVATQMANARLRFTTATIVVDDATFRASGREVLFAGFMRVYVQGSDDPEAALESQDAPLPPLALDEVVQLIDLNADGHETKPPARFTEASLVKALEAEGIGRPSTYASIIDTILQRSYAFKRGKELIPTFTAFAVTQLLEQHFSDLVDTGFTAGMEEQLDEIANGSFDWLDYLRTFFLGSTGLEAQVEAKDRSIDPRSVGAIDLADLPAEPPTEVRIGQFGPYLSRQMDGAPQRATIPPDLPPADLTSELIEQIFTQKIEGPRKLGVEPESEQMVTLRTGRFGPYVQLGEEEPGSKEKPRRASLLKQMNADEVTLETALQLLSLPRTLGEHPETGEPVVVGVGRYGPYVLYEKKYVSVREPDNVLDMDLDRALEVLANPNAGRRGARSSASGNGSGLRTIGEHPEGGAIQAGEGRFGPYVKHGKIFASIPKDTAPESVTVEMALPWLAEKAARAPSKPTRSRTTSSKGKTAKSGTTTRGAATKSPASKSAATKGTGTKSTAAKSKNATAKSATAKPAKAKTATAKGAATRSTSRTSAAPKGSTKAGVTASTGKSATAKADSTKSTTAKPRGSATKS
jgi:DNA topoisomerase-1